MVRFSKRENYATILIAELSENINQKFIPLSQIAKKHGISILFLRNIALDLRKAELIEALEGKNGGYRLKKSKNKIRIGDVVEAVTHRSIFSCCQNTKSGKCDAKLCPHGFSLQRLNNQLLENLSKITFDKLNK